MNVSDEFLKSNRNTTSGIFNKIEHKQNVMFDDIFENGEEDDDTYQRDGTSDDWNHQRYVLRNAAG